MNTLVTNLKTELQGLFDAHTCIVTDEMKFKRDAQIEMLPKLTRQKAHSFTVFDLNEARFMFHSSAYDKWLNEPCIRVDEKENYDLLFELTHPNDRLNALKTKLKAYDDLMNLPTWERSEFSFRYLRRIKDNKGAYQVYIHCVSVLLCDDNCIPWLMLINTERLPECCCNEKCMADIYKLLPLLDITKDLPKVDFNMTDHQLKILGMVYEGFENKEIASKLNISKYTILGHYTIIRKKLNVKSIQMAAIYAKIIGLLNVFVFYWG